MAALNAKKTNPACKALFDRLGLKGKNKKLALVAVCNKLLKQVFVVVRSRVPYSDQYYKYCLKYLIFYTVRVSGSLFYHHRFYILKCQQVGSPMLYKWIPMC